MCARSLGVRQECAIHQPELENDLCTENAKGNGRIRSTLNVEFTYTKLAVFSAQSNHIFCEDDLLEGVTSRFLFFVRIGVDEEIYTSCMLPVWRKTRVRISPPT